jgi:hypothetical protein
MESLRKQVDGPYSVRRMRDGKDFIFANGSPLSAVTPSMLDSDQRIREEAEPAAVLCDNLLYRQIQRLKFELDPFFHPAMSRVPG